jgi:hypothetical protein
MNKQKAKLNNEDYSSYTNKQYENPPTKATRQKPGRYSKDKVSATQTNKMNIHQQR